jgi:S-methylmethionine-dependent homocysteine/selenocysteine methylase
MDSLPQLQNGRLFITDGGLETTLIFHQGIELPHFAAFDLLRHERGPALIRSYYEPYLEIARERGAGMILDTVTWRANPDWGARLGYSEAGLADANRRAVALANAIRDEHDDVEIVIDGCIGPRGDGYSPVDLMTEEEAERYHSVQISTFAEGGVEMLTALTIPYVEEGVGLVRAAEAAGLPIALSFTVETDGRLPSGQPLRAAVEQVDEQTGGSAAYFMVNCAHPTHFAGVLDDGGPWLERIRGIRANSSTRSHAELDEAQELDGGDPAQFAADHRALYERLPNLAVVGGCCGTDHRHVAAVSA